MTDANLVLGYLDPAHFLGGRSTLDAAAAEARGRRPRARSSGRRPHRRSGRHPPRRQHQHGRGHPAGVGAARRRSAAVRAAVLRRRGRPARHRCRAPARAHARGRAARRRRALGLGHAGDRSALRGRAHAYRRCRQLRRRRGQAALRGDGGGGPATAPRLPTTGRCAAALRRTCATASRSSRSTCRSTTWTGRSPDPLPQIVERFHRRHEELYTYALRDQEAVLVNARVAVDRRAAGPAAGAAPRRRGARARPRGERRIYLGDWTTRAGLRLRRAGTGAGDRGPGDRGVRDDDRAAAARATQPRMTPHGWLDIACPWAPARRSEGGRSTRSPSRRAIHAFQKGFSASNCACARLMPMSCSPRASSESNCARARCCCRQ